jgi:hypothetical protein
MCNTKLEGGGGLVPIIVLLELVLVSYSSTHSFGAFSPLHGTGDHHYFAFGTTFGFASSLSNVNQPVGKGTNKGTLGTNKGTKGTKGNSIGWLVGWLVGYALEQALIDLSILPVDRMASHPTRLTVFVKQGLVDLSIFNTDRMASTLDNNKFILLFCWFLEIFPY